MMVYGKIDPYMESQRQAKIKQRRRWVIIGLSSLLLLLLVVSAVSVGVAVSQSRSSSHLAPANSESSDESLTAGSKAIEQACNTTIFPDVCMKDLSAHPDAITANPRQLVAISVKIAFEHTGKTYSLAVKLSREPGGFTEGMAIDNCVEMMDIWQDKLNESISELESLKMVVLKEQLYNVRVWMSSVLTYESSCNDGFDDIPPTERGNRTVAMKEDLDGLKKVIFVAFNLVNSLANLGTDISSWKGKAKPEFRRRLLSNVDGEGFPHWVSAMDRKLLQAPASSPLIAPASSPSMVVPAITISVDRIVSQGGDGDYKSIAEAVKDIPASLPTGKRWVIHIKAGVYNEIVRLQSNHKFVTFIGDGIGKTIITGDRNVGIQKFTTFDCAITGVVGDSFMAKGITFRNTAGPEGYQALALRTGADYLIFDSCSFEGYQDTLCPHVGRQFFYNCDIYGTIDFIFGNAIAVFQKSRIYARLPLHNQMNIVTAHGRQSPDDPSGYSFQDCTIAATEEVGTQIQTYLGRPWKPYSRTVFMLSSLGSVVHPDGWLPWDPSQPLAFAKTVSYGEYNNSGPGSDTSHRVKWGGVNSKMSYKDASAFSVANFLASDDQSWLTTSALDVAFTIPGP